MLLIFVAAYLRKVLHAAAGPGEILSLVAFVGLVIVAIGFAIDAMISFALAEAAADIDPTAAPRSSWRDGIPVGDRLAVLKSGLPPRWLGWVMIALGVSAATPIGFSPRSAPRSSCWCSASC